jgi:hypothetical protein
MDSNRFDRWTRHFARRLSRRDALRLAGAGGATAALASTALPAFAQTTCSLQIHGETVAGPSAPAKFDGVLTFTVGDDGVFSQATYTPKGKIERAVTGRATGRAIDFQPALGGKQHISFSGAAEQPLETCQGAVAGTFSGPQPGDLGGWQATAGTAPANTGGQSTTGAAPEAPTPTPPPSQGNTQPPAQNPPGGGGGGGDGGGGGGGGSACLELHSQCNQSSECCSGWCTDNECRSCGDTICGEDCIVLSDNLAHCGACFNACNTDTQTCVDGTCTGGDGGGGGGDGGGGGCVDLGGGCGFSAQCCSGFCNAGTCGSCGMVVCNDQCVDTSSDNNNCGNCNNMCIGTTCQNGSCQ